MAISSNKGLSLPTMNTQDIRHQRAGHSYTRCRGVFKLCVVTPLALQSRLVSIYMFVDKKIFESYFSDRLTFSKIRRTSCRIYKLALPLHAPETLSSLSKSKISIFNAHLTLFVRRMTSHNSIGKYCHLVN